MALGVSGGLAAAAFLRNRTERRVASMLSSSTISFEAGSTAAMFLFAAVLLATLFFSSIAAIFSFISSENGWSAPGIEKTALLVNERRMAANPFFEGRALPASMGTSLGAPLASLLTRKLFGWRSNWSVTKSIRRTFCVSSGGIV